MKKSPLQTVKEKFESKAKLVQAVKALGKNDLWNEKLNEDKGLEHVSNQKLLRLHGVLSDVKSRFGSRKALVDEILKLEKRSKDAGYRSRLESYNTPRLADKQRSLAKKEKQATA